MVKTVLYAENLYDNDKVEREVFGPDVRVVWRGAGRTAAAERHHAGDVLMARPTVAVIEALRAARQRLVS